jgi:nucleoid DNA-binding protein
MKLSKKDITDKIYKRLNKAVSKLVIQDVVTVICDHILSELEKDRVFSVTNFGTFSPFKFHEHDGMDISSGAIQKVSSFRSVKFRPHAVFRLLLDRKRKKFEKDQ